MPYVCLVKLRQWHLQLTFTEWFTQIFHHRTAVHRLISLNSDIAEVVFIFIIIITVITTTIIIYVYC